MRRGGDLWAPPDRKMVLPWTLGVPMGPFLLLQAWRSEIRSYEGAGAKFHDVFLHYRLEESVEGMT